MAVRGKYSESEKKMLQDFDRDAETRQGWSKGAKGMADFMPNPPFVTKEAIMKSGFEKDPYNPFWSSEEYATKSRWGGLIAHPWFLENYKPDERMLQTPKEFFRTFYLMGHEFELFQPIRPGDTIRTWEIKPTLEDTTDPNGGPRMFRYMDGMSDMVNQRDEIIASFKQYVYVILHESHEKMPQDKYLGDYGYTQKELDYIEELTEKIKIRGPETRYWEDLKVGDLLDPIVNGPTPYTTMDFFAGRKPTGRVEKPMFTKYEEQTGGPLMFGYVPDPKTGLLYPTQGGRHNNDRCAQYEGGPQAWLFNFVPRLTMLRCVTNWMGDDAFMCKFEWRHPFRTPVGDTLIAKGEVVKKYSENNENLVDIRIWCDNFRGTITDMALATVKLVSKKDYPGFKKIIKR